VIIAVWAKDIHYFYKTEDIARALGYNNSDQDGRRTLVYFRYKYLV